MRLYLVPNDPERTTLVSTNGVAHYKVTTTKTHRLAPAVLHIRRPAESEDDSFVADVEWKRFGAHPVVRTSVLDGMMQVLQVRELLYKLGKHFTPTRYFLGNDDEEYKWKPEKGSGHVLSQLKSGQKVARFGQELVKEGFFQGERKWCLHIEPTMLDIDIIVLTFIIMEKRRRDRVAAECMRNGDRDEDPAEGGCEGGMGG
ncbi:hypothetical protein K466DRAFT_575625 [Polyporus arcularius HHB13444]|uniref:DUF6593 domain-containing protein n=1 Tax=Polyporus arcularius HHB13444 TaxID=1314778 RepID=A0A5C3PDV7_9APHY|nr:hypothetical protein K466DRAFT_575625 [Polyporus arcularius HHB13444]